MLLNNYSFDNYCKSWWQEISYNQGHIIFQSDASLIIYCYTNISTYYVLNKQYNYLFSWYNTIIQPWKADYTDLEFSVIY